MNGIWQWLIGRIRFRLISADPERLLRRISEQVELTEINWESGLELSASALRTDLDRIKRLLRTEEDRLEVLELQGFPTKLRNCFCYPLICTVVALLLAATVWLPGRVLFVLVEGNQTLPDALILDCAEQCGLGFGADRQVLRSEQVKNRLLSALPELSWVGVNTRGCVATISVQERQREPEGDEVFPGNVVASSDAIVLTVTATAGDARCVPGDAVKQGQVLISGYTDLGLCTHVEPAAGEVYGLTARSISAKIPSQILSRTEKGAEIKKFSLIFGKKRINFYSDSGILHTGCGKMTKIRYLRLPGGWTLPIALITQTYISTELTESERYAPEALDLLRQISRQTTLEQMTAGRIVSVRESELYTEGGYGLESVYECEEMIGIRRSGILTEGDIHDDGENG